MDPVALPVRWRRVTLQILLKGQRTQFFPGVYRALTHGGATSSGNFRTVVLANSLATRGRDDVAVALTKRDVASVESIGKRLERCSQAPASKDAMPTGFGCALRALGAAFAPSIYGHDAIKSDSSASPHLSSIYIYIYIYISGQ